MIVMSRDKQRVQCLRETADKPLFDDLFFSLQMLTNHAKNLVADGDLNKTSPAEDYSCEPSPSWVTAFKIYPTISGSKWQIYHQPPNQCRSTKDHMPQSAGLFHLISL